MTTSDWITLGAAILTGGGTLFLGFMAWRTIRQTKNIREVEKRERLLNEINTSAMEFQELVFISGTSEDFDFTQWSIRFSNLLFEYSAIKEYAKLFGTELKHKARSLETCIGDYQKEIVSQQIKKDGKIFVVDKKERLEIRDRVIKSVAELKEEIIKEKIKLVK